MTAIVSSKHGACFRGERRKCGGPGETFCISTMMAEVKSTGERRELEEMQVETILHRYEITSLDYANVRTSSGTCI